jgi:endonuclease YncB( thermonuclease family)
VAVSETGTETSFWNFPSFTVIDQAEMGSRKSVDFVLINSRGEPVGTGNEYRCGVDNQDLSRVVLFNGGGRATANATQELRAAEQEARSTRVGIWSGRDDED